MPLTCEKYSPFSHLFDHHFMFPNSANNPQPLLTLSFIKNTHTYAHTHIHTRTHNTRRAVTIAVAECITMAIELTENALYDMLPAPSAPVVSKASAAPQPPGVCVCMCVCLFVCSWSKSKPDRLSIRLMRGRCHPVERNSSSSSNMHTLSVHVVCVSVCMCASVLETTA